VNQRLPSEGQAEDTALVWRWVLVGAVWALGCSSSEPSGVPAPTPTAPTPTIASATEPPPSREPVPTPEPAPSQTPPAQPRAAADIPAGSLRWLAAAAGSIPEMSQVQIEQDIALAADVFGDGGRVLFGAGRDKPTVQVLTGTSASERDVLRLRLGDLFAPRGGRDARYRRPNVSAADAATASTVLDTLDEAIAQSGDPLLVYLGGHGDMGETPRDNRIALWGQTDITVADLGEVLDGAKRPVRLVVTTCFSGGFGELAFHGSDASRGAARNDRCGLFAAPWDLEATGCDPNPDRAAQEGYGLHFLNALRGQDRNGKPLPSETLDIDGDGNISLLEAHTRARLASESADVPTTTSERWLRATAPTAGRMLSVALPEEDRVIKVLAERLGLSTSDAGALTKLERLEDDIDAQQLAVANASRDEDAAYRRASASLLALWPVLDDPWHPDFAETLQRDANAIEAHLERSDAYADYLAARERTDLAQQAVWDLRLEAAPVERLVRAQENRALAGRLAARGGRDWSHFQALLACERWVRPQ